MLLREMIGLALTTDCHLFPQQDQKTVLVKELKEATTKARRRSMGNIQFIGELYRLKMLTENIMHDCIFKLLKIRDDDSIECLTKLLETIGKDLDHPKAKVGRFITCVVWTVNCV